MLFLESIQKVDTALLYAINCAYHPALDILFATLSNTEFFYPVMALLSIALITLGKRRGLHLLAVILIILLITDKALIWPMRKAVNRPRPHEVLPNIRSAILELPRIQIGNKSHGIPVIPTLDRIRIEVSPPGQAEKPPPPSGRSFISGHAATNMILANCTAAFFPSLAVPFYTWAFFIGYSRIYNGLHYPSDIFLGWFFGALVSWGVLSLHRRCFPGVY
jgi:undecaprenyl-diphosphatase